MLLSLRFKNFKSFSRETIIDFKPSKIEYLEESNLFNNILKGCAFYGENGSGKTNALCSMTLLLDLLFKEFVINPDAIFTKFNKDSKMYFEYTFDVENNIIVYFIEYDKRKGFTSEKLFQNKNLVLDRTLTSAKSFITDNQDYDEIDKNTLFLRSIYFNTKFSNYPVLQKWFDFLKKSIYFNPIRDYSKIVNFDPTRNSEVFLEGYLDKYGEDDINSFLTKFGFPFIIKYDKLQPGVTNLMSPFPSRLNFIRNNLSPIPFYLESTGNQILLLFLPSYLTVIKDGGILAIDEFSSGFHNQLEEMLVKYFYKNSKEAQLIFVTHSTNILKTSFIRPDQVYSTEFRDNSSALIKFSAFGMRESQNMEKMYLSGSFGGIPLYDDKN